MINVAPPMGAHRSGSVRARRMRRGASARRCSPQRESWETALRPGAEAAATGPGAAAADGAATGGGGGGDGPGGGCGCSRRSRASGDGGGGRLPESVVEVPQSSDSWTCGTREPSRGSDLLKVFRGLPVGSRLLQKTVVQVTCFVMLKRVPKSSICEYVLVP
jgi:hypothetical protein